MLSMCNSFPIDRNWLGHYSVYFYITHNITTIFETLHEKSITGHLNCNETAYCVLWRTLSGPYWFRPSPTAIRSGQFHIPCRASALSSRIRLALIFLLMQSYRSVLGNNNNVTFFIQQVVSKGNKTSLIET